MLDAICLSQIFHILVYEWVPIVTYQFPGDPEPCNDVLSNEFTTTAPMAFFKRIASTHFVKYSVVARIQM